MKTAYQQYGTCGNLATVRGVDWSVVGMPVEAPRMTVLSPVRRDGEVLRRRQHQKNLKRLGIAMDMMASVAMVVLAVVATMAFLGM